MKTVKQQILDIVREQAWEQNVQFCKAWVEQAYDGYVEALRSGEPMSGLLGRTPNKLQCIVLGAMAEVLSDAEV